MKSRRLLSIDILRTVALVLMVQTHFMEYLTPGEGPYEALYVASVWDFWGIVSAPLFSFLLGLSFWFWMQKTLEQGKSSAQISRIAWLRGIFIFIFGLFFCVSIWLPDQIFAWDILTFLGFSLVLLSMLRSLPSWVFPVLILAVIAISPSLREATGYATHWDGDEYIYEFTFFDISMGFLSHAYFGVFPWIIYPLAGFGLGKHYFSGPTDEKFTRFFPGLLGLSLMALGYGSVYAGDALPNFTGEMTFYPANTTYLVAYLGICIFLFWALYLLIDRTGTANTKNFQFFSLYSKYSLTVYYLHHAVHIWPIYLLAFIEKQEEIDWYYGDFTSPPMALLFAAIFLVVFYFILKIWDKHGGKYSLEWFIHKAIERI